MLNNPLFKWINTHPRVSAWVVLSVGMVGLLAIEARDVGLLVGQWIALIVATVIVAGLCIWIISWEDSEDETEDGAVLASVNDDPKQNDNAEATTA
jgi:hypothetical protein